MIFLQMRRTSSEDLQETSAMLPEFLRLIASIIAYIIQAGTFNEIR